jgi:DNA-binding CsgD family transcriptional regulator
LVAEAVSWLTEKRRWDECLFVLERFPRDGLVLATLERALPEILDSGTIVSLRRWLDLAARLHLQGGVLMLAESEEALRHGDNQRAMALGEQAAFELSGEYAARAFLVAARAAHLRDEPEATTSRLCDLSLSQAGSRVTQLSALWTAFASATERVDAEHLQRTYRRLSKFDETGATHAARMSTARAFLSARKGEVKEALRHLERAKEFVPSTNDPFVRTTILHQLSYMYVLVARYDAALVLADDLSREAKDAGLAFVEHHGLLVKITAYAGLRRFGRAQTYIAELQRQGKPISEFIQSNVRLKSARIAMAVGDLERATAILASYRDDMTARPAFRGEVLGYRAIIAATQGDLDTVSSCLDRRDGLFGFVETRALSDVAKAISALRSMRDPLVSLRPIVAAGELDAVVIGYRACPELVSAAVGTDLEGSLTDLLVSSHDFDIARAAGLRIPREAMPRQHLSAREKEVYELLAQGLSNHQIAKTLFISQSTTKVHVRHIFEKLGVHSRAEAARMAAEMDQS